MTTTTNKSTTTTTTTTTTNATNSICSICFEEKKETVVLCKTSTSSSLNNCNAKFCQTCIQLYLADQKNSYAICENIMCPGSCGTIIPMSKWMKHANKETQTSYMARLFARLTIRCPACHVVSDFCGHAVQNPTTKNIELAKTRQEIMEERARAAAVAAAVLEAVLEAERPSLADLFVEEEDEESITYLTTNQFTDEWFMRSIQAGYIINTSKDTISETKQQKHEEISLLSIAGQRIVTESDLTAAEDIVAAFIKRKGETKEPIGKMLKPFISEVIARGFGKENNIETFAALFQAFLRRAPHILTGCCKTKVCFHCSVNGWHENFHGSCEDYLKVEFGDVDTMNENLKSCPKCQISLLKAEGCSSVQCPNCQNKFDWKEAKLNVP